MLNINGSTDPSYRYKMPRVVGKVEGRGNGIKTVIVNCREVSSSLKRPTEQLTKFIGLQMGASSRIEHDKSIVNGAIDTAELQKLITVYIEKFVLCPKCGNPETVQKLATSSGSGGKKSSAGLVVLKCKACGETTQADNSHRLITQIVKELSEGSKDSGEKKKKGEDAGGVPGIKNNADAQNEAAAAAETSKDSSKKSKKSKDSSKKDSKKSKKKDKESKLPAFDADQFRLALERLTLALDADGAEGADGDAQLHQAEQLCLEFGLAEKRDLVPLVWSACVGNRTAKALQSVERFQPALSAVVRASKKNPTKLLACAAGYSGEDEKRIKAVPLAVKALFDFDVLSDEDILGWYSNKSTVLDARVRKQLLPLIEWLEAEDEEEESSEEEEEGEDGNSSSSSSSPPAKQKKKRATSSTTSSGGSSNNTSTEDEEDED